MVPRTEPTEVTHSIVERPTPEPPPTPPDMCSDYFYSNSTSLATESNDCQNESTPCEDHATSPADIGEEYTVPLLAR